VLLNPFTPSEIASLPEDFFGRRNELDLLERSLAKGYVAIQGAIGIGKSSLLARVRLVMEGFNSGHQCDTVMAVGNRDIHTVDDAARLLLDRFLQCDETHNTVKIMLPKVFEFESGSICRFFKEGRHLAVLNNLIEERRLPEGSLLLLAIDEADRCPVPLARLIRSVTTQIQHSGIKNIRFALAGVSPFFQSMVNEDGGVSRFFYKAMTLLPLSEDEALELVETKLREVVKDANKQKLPLVIRPDVVERIVRLSGGHPHLLQLLGSHLIEHENEDPDGVLDARDLVNVLRTICYDDRARVYDSTLHTLDMEQKLEQLRKLLLIASAKCPTRINRIDAHEQVESEVLDWLVAHNILALASADDYGLVDEFLRIRLLLDDIANEEMEGKQEGIQQIDGRDLEQLLVREGRFLSKQEEWERDRQGDVESGDEEG
jgi:hypothetical protein